MSVEIHKNHATGQATVTWNPPGNLHLAISLKYMQGLSLDEARKMIFERLAEHLLKTLKDEIFGPGKTSGEALAAQEAPFQGAFEKHLYAAGPNDHFLDLYHAMSSHSYPQKWTTGADDSSKTSKNDWETSNPYEDIVAMKKLIHDAKKEPPPWLGTNASAGVLGVLRSAFPKAMTLRSLCPDDDEGLACFAEAKSISDLIPHLNDHHRWTAAQIAEWLENTFDPEEIAS